MGLQQGGRGLPAAARRLGFHVGDKHCQGLRQRQGAGQSDAAKNVSQNCLCFPPFQYHVCIFRQSTEELMRS